MTPSDKMEMQVNEEQDGSAVVELPEGEIIIDDAPEENKGKPESDFRGNDDFDDEPAKGEEVDPEREKIREARREERKLKKQLHREKARESNHLITALRKQNEALAERLAVIEKKTSGSELAQVNKAIEDAGVQVEYAKMKMQEAVESNDGMSLTKAQEMWYEAKRKQEALQNLKVQATKQASQPPKQNIDVPDPMVQKLAADWMEQNKWYDPHGKDLDSEIAQKIDKKLTEEGYDPSTQDYWDELDDRLEKYIPQKANRGYNEPSVRNQRPRSVVTSSGRESTATAKTGAYVLSPDRVAAIKEAGAWDDPVRKMKMINNFRAWDRENKGRN